MTTPKNVRNTKAPGLRDPLLSFKFLISWDMRVVAGVSKIGALTRSTQVVAHREGGAPQTTRQIPGQVTYGPITLERGLIIDVAFEEWANKVWWYENSGALGQEVSLKDFRKDLTIQLCNQAGQIMKQWLAFNCWPSEFTGMPELDAAGNAVALESMTLQSEGWQRDDAFKAPDPLYEYELVPQPSLPVRARAQSVMGPLRRPSVTGVTPAIVDYEPAAEVTLLGEHLDDPRLLVRVDGASGTIHSATEDRLVFSLPTKIQAGAHTVTVVGVGGSSEPASFIVRPTVDPLAELSADGKTISVAAAPVPANGGQAELLLNETGKPRGRSPRSFQFTGSLGGDGRLHFSLPKSVAEAVAGASYLFRVEMGGVGSALTVGADGRYDGPVVEIPA